MSAQTQRKAQKVWTFTRMRLFRKSSIALGVCSLVTPALLAGCAGAADDGAVQFRFANRPPSCRFVRIADELGYFDNAGVRPEYVGPATAVPAVHCSIRTPSMSRPACSTAISTGK